MNLSTGARKWAAGIAALAAGLAYFVQSWYHARTQASVLDEGLYIVKGYLFATGQYAPFQDYGPWTNHMPLSFLIPGYAQKWFGPGLLTSRIFAVAVGLLTLLALWITARNLGGKWWAAGAVWAVALNPAIIKIFSVTASQGLAACILMWALAFSLGEGRKLWQVALGAAFAGALLLTRINLTPVLPLLLLYVFWQHGLRTGLWAAGAGLLVVGLGHAAFWPGILRMWSGWVPDFIHFIDPWRRAAGVRGVWHPTISTFQRVLSFFQGVRYHFTALVSVLGLALFFPRRAAWKNPSQFRLAVFGLGLFTLLFLLHGWAALIQSYCVFCFPIYLSFFSLAGLALLAGTFSAWKLRESDLRHKLIPPLILALWAGIGLSSFDVIGPKLVGIKTVRKMLNTQVPRISRTGIGEGTIELWGLLGNIFELGFEDVVLRTQYFTRLTVSALLGLAVGFFLLWLAARGRVWFARWDAGALTFGARAMVALLGVGFLLTPTAALSGGYHTYDCGKDVIAAHETAGDYLRTVIPPEAKVYWQTENSPAVLLYLPDIFIYPPQLNGGYSFRTGGEKDNNPIFQDTLVKYGHWSQPIAEGWLAEADVVLLENSFYQRDDQDWLIAAIQAGPFTELTASPPIHPCYPDSRIHVFTKSSE